MLRGISKEWRKRKRRSLWKGALLTAALLLGLALLARPALMLFLQTGAMGTETDGMDMRFGKITATYTVDSRGILKKINMVFDASMKMEFPIEDGAAFSMDVAYAYDMTMTVNATGKSVKITFPDFSGYQEIPMTSVGTTPAA